MRFISVWDFASGLILLQMLTTLAGVSAPGVGRDLRDEVAQSKDACGVMDNPLAEQALKGPVRRDTNPQSSLPGLCAWRSASTAGDALTIRVDAGGESKFVFDRSKLPVRDLTGVGDKAFFFVSPAGFVQIGMMSGGDYVTIVLMLQNGADRLQRSTELAKAIAARMGR